MTGQNRREQLDSLGEKFTDSESCDIIKANKEAFANASLLQDLIASEAGEVLLKEIRTEMTKAMSQLLLTRDGRYLSDFESNLNILTKLTGAKAQADAIGNWIDSLGDN